MCGRFYYILNTLSKDGRIIKSLVQQLSIDDFMQGEVFPSQRILTLVLVDKIIPKVCTWGLLGFQQRLLINARNETVSQKPTFKRILHNRCVIPCNGFYEWNQDKQKIYIQKEGIETMYLAGLYDDDRCVILTGEATNQMKEVHHRTPLILNKTQMIAYLNHDLQPIVDNKDLVFMITE